MKWCLWIVVKYQRKEALINGLNPILHELFDHRFLLGGGRKCISMKLLNQKSWERQVWHAGWRS